MSYIQSVYSTLQTSKFSMTSFYVTSFIYLWPCMCTYIYNKFSLTSFHMNDKCTSSKARMIVEQLSALVIGRIVKVKIK